MSKSSIYYKLLSTLVVNFKLDGLAGEQVLASSAGMSAPEVLKHHDLNIIKLKFTLKKLNNFPKIKTHTGSVLQYYRYGERE